MFAAGVLVGVLVATFAYALVERQRNSGDSGRDVVVLKLGHGLDVGHPVHLAMERMAERMAELSDGTVKIQISPNGQLGTETECIELLQRGALALTKTSTAPLESFLPEMAVFGVPYVFLDAEHCWRALDSEIGAELLAAGESSGVIGLCWYDAGARSFYTKSTPILTPDDLQGLKIRVQNSQTALQTIQALGGSPTPMNFGELYTGLQQGLVDGAENNPPSFHFSRHYEVCKHYCLDEHTLVPDVLLMSTVWWERLTPEAQGWLRQAAKESSQWQRQAWEEETAESIAAVEAAGVTIHYPDKAEFVERVKPMHAAYEGTVVGDLMSRISELGPGE